MARTSDSLAELLTELAQLPSPALIHHDDAGRVELSGRVLVNWVEKAAGLLTDDLEVAAGDTVLVGVRPHWRLLVIALAALRVGASVRYLGPGESSDSQATVHAELEAQLDPDTFPAAETGLVVAHAPLAFSCDTPVQAPDVDFCADVRAMADHYAGLEHPRPADLALPALGLTHAQLSQTAREAAQALEPVDAASALAASQSELAAGTVCLEPADEFREHHLLAVLGVLAAHGTVLTAAAPQLLTAHVLGQERAVRVCSGAW